MTLPYSIIHTYDVERVYYGEMMNSTDHNAGISFFEHFILYNNLVVVHTI